MAAGLIAVTYEKAREQLARIGCAHAKGKPLAAMYADLIAVAHGGSASRYYGVLVAHDDPQPVAIVLLRDRSAAWDALMEGVRA